MTSNPTKKTRMKTESASSKILRTNMRQKKQELARQYEKTLDEEENLISIMADTVDGKREKQIKALFALQEQRRNDKYVRELWEAEK